jgi:hypothetical protein
MIYYGQPSGWSLDACQIEAYHLNLTMLIMPGNTAKTSARTAKNCHFSENHTSQCLTLLLVNNVITVLLLSKKT